MQAPRSVRWVISILLCALSALPVHAADWRDTFTDPIDQRLDASRWLLERRGFLPTPLIITEPAVGYGGGVALGFFHRKAPPATVDSTAEVAPPSITGLAAAATDNGTKFGALGHLGVWRNNTVRYSGGIAALSLNLKFYGAEEFPRLSEGIQYNIEGWGTFHQLAWRWPDSDLWLGGQIVYFDAATQLESDLPAYERLEGDVSNTGAGIMLSYDGRDSIFTPNRGFQSQWTARQHWGEFARSFDYIDIGSKNRWYFQPGSRWVLGWRLDGSYTSEGAPFYALPFINQRGIPKGRYQGAAVLTTEVELRYAFDTRWYGVAFAGVGRAADSASDLGGEDDRWAGGGGIRYLLARALGMQAGLDIARGPDEWTIYIQMGSGWAF